MIEKGIWYEVEQKHPQWGWRRTIGSSGTMANAMEKALEMSGETRIVEITRTRRIIEDKATRPQGEK